MGFLARCRRETDSRPIYLRAAGQAGLKSQQTAWIEFVAAMLRPFGDFSARFAPRCGPAIVKCTLFSNSPGEVEGLVALDKVVGRIGTGSTAGGGYMVFFVHGGIRS